MHFKAFCNSYISSEWTFQSSQSDFVISLVLLMVNKIKIKDMSEIISESSTAAVYIKDLSKSFNSGDVGKVLVLNNFCMSVKRGSMLAKKYIKNL